MGSRQRQKGRMHAQPWLDRHGVAQIRPCRCIAREACRYPTSTTALRRPPTRVSEQLRTVSPTNVSLFGECLWKCATWQQLETPGYVCRVLLFRHLADYFHIFKMKTETVCRLFVSQHLVKRAPLNREGKGHVSWTLPPPEKNSRKVDFPLHIMQ